jgi:hypothetical protein
VPCTRHATICNPKVTPTLPQTAELQCNPPVSCKLLPSLQHDEVHQLHNIRDAPPVCHHDSWHASTSKCGCTASHALIISSGTQFAQLTNRGCKSRTRALQLIALHPEIRNTLSQDSIAREPHTCRKLNATIHDGTTARMIVTSCVASSMVFISANASADV